MLATCTEHLACCLWTCRRQRCLVLLEVTAAVEVACWKREEVSVIAGRRSFCCTQTFEALCRSCMRRSCE
jgi:hypothetical protein